MKAITTLLVQRIATPIYLLLCLSLSLVSPFQALAVSPETAHKLRVHSELYDSSIKGPLAECQGASTTVSAASVTPGELPATVPEPLNKIASAAGKKFKVPPALVAAIYFVENNGIQGPDVSKYKWRDPAPPDGKGAPWAVSSASAMGPFQFLSGTWGSYKVDGNGDGKTDILSMWDAGFGAAKYLRSLGAKEGASESTLERAAGGYEAGHATDSPYGKSAIALYKHFSGAGGDTTKTVYSPLVTKAYAAAADPPEAAKNGSVPSGYKIPADTLALINKNKSVYVQASEKTDVPWTALAAIHFREAGNDPSKDLGAGNPLGGGGSQYSSQSASKTLLESAIKAGKELQGKAEGGVIKKKLTASNPDPELLKDAFFGYNGRNSGYGAAAAKYGFSADKQPYEGSPYVMSKYDKQREKMGIVTHDFGPIDGIDGRAGAFTIYVLLGGGDAAVGGAAAGCSGASAGAGGVGIGKDGFVFPLKTTKAAVIKGAQYDGHAWVWCYKSHSSCHHDYKAADIHAEPGTPVVAVVGGTVVKADDPPVCSGTDAPRLRIKGDDGKWYFYQHLKPGTVKLTANQKVKAGDQLGEIGPGACAENTGPHIHFDVSPVENGFSRPSPIATSTLLDPQPALLAAFANLPEN